MLETTLANNFVLQHEISMEFFSPQEARLRESPRIFTLPGSNPGEDTLGIGKPRGAVALKE